MRYSPPSTTPSQLTTTHSMTGVRMVRTAATCSAIAECNSGVEFTIRKLYGAVDIVSGTQMVTSAKKADTQRLRQSLRQAQASTEEARRARKVA